MNTKTIGRLFFYAIFLIIIGFFFKEQVSAAFSEFNGFDLSDSLINAQEIHHGGPAKDGIPALDQPAFINAVQASSLAPDDRILGLSINGMSKAYPISILNYHEIVNDFVHDKAVVITYCPLCGSGIAYSARVNGVNTTFGVSGLLYNSDVLLYDRETESLWSQLLSKAVSGSQKGTSLEMLVLTHTTWRDWKKQYPDTLVLSDKTGFNRDYSQSPYGDYDRNQTLYFPVNSLNNQYHPKEYVLGLKMAGQTKVYPFAELSKIKSPYKDSIAGQEITVFFDAENRTGKILDKNQREIPTTIAFWFAWLAFYPDSTLFNKQ